MKKLLLLGLLFTAATLWAADENVSRMFIHPGRETFVHFPTAALSNQYTLTVFLPEDFVPLSRRYPLVVLLGAGPKQAELARAVQEKTPCIIAALNFADADFEKSAAIEEFVAWELMPYLETNYWLLQDPAQRFIAAAGSGADTALRLAARPGLFGGIMLLNPQTTWPAIPRGRVFIRGAQAQLARAQAVLEAAGKSYGPDFALRSAVLGDTVFSALAVEYMRYTPQQARLVRLDAHTRGSVLSFDHPLAMRVWAELAGGFYGEYVPTQLRISPPFAAWDAQTGQLHAISGAEPGRIKLSSLVDKPGFTLKIKLKRALN